MEEVDPVKKIFFINFSKLSLAGVAILVGGEVIDKILQKTQLGIIPPKFGSNWASSFQTYKFFHDFLIGPYVKLCWGHLT